MLNRKAGADHTAILNGALQYQRRARDSDDAHRARAIEGGADRGHHRRTESRGQCDGVAVDCEQAERVAGGVHRRGKQGLARARIVSPAAGDGKHFRRVGVEFGIAKGRLVIVVFRFRRQLGEAPVLIGHGHFGEGGHEVGQRGGGRAVPGHAHADAVNQRGCGGDRKHRRFAILAGHPRAAERGCKIVPDRLTNRHISFGIDVDAAVFFAPHAQVAAFTGGIRQGMVRFLLFPCVPFRTTLAFWYAQELLVGFVAQTHPTGGRIVLLSAIDDEIGRDTESNQLFTQSRSALARQLLVVASVAHVVATADQH